MKQITLGLIFSAISIFSYGQWQTNGTSIYYNSGNVGIGTNAPSHLLHILNTSGNHKQLVIESDEKGGETALNIISSIDNASLNINSGGSTYQGNTIISFRYQSDVLFNLGTDHSNNDNFTIGNNAYYDNSYFSIKTSGEVGINEVNPTEKLVVNGNILIKDNNALILTSQNGTKFKITVDDNGNLTATQAETTKLTHVENNVSVDIFPNPVDNQLTVKINEQTVGSVDTEIYNMSGKMILMKKYSSNSFQINLSNLKKGMYLLKIKDGEGNLIKSEKIIKQ